MRYLWLCLVVSSAAFAQPADAPLRFELASLRQEREFISLARPLTLTFIGLGALTGGAVFDAATARVRPPGTVSVWGCFSYVVTSLTLVPGLFTLLATLAERWMLDGHIRELERELGLVRG